MCLVCPFHFLDYNIEYPIPWGIFIRSNFYKTWWFIAGGNDDGSLLIARTMDKTDSKGPSNCQQNLDFSTFPWWGLGHFSPCQELGAVGEKMCVKLRPGDVFFGEKLIPLQRPTSL